MAVRKLLTRAESQAQTGADLVAAAERLFLAEGYHATSIAAIAAEAGRTVGAVYSNFENKESLCYEVIRQRVAAEGAKLVAIIAAAPEPVEARLAILPTWWAEVSVDTAMITLAGEYLATIIRDADQRSIAADRLDRIIATGRALLEDFLPAEVQPSSPLLDTAVRAVVATGAGLAIGQAAQAVSLEEATGLLADTLRLWLSRLTLADQRGVSVRYS
ncbi:TetR/AcrR family transcriptional regulator [Nocardia brasiliensis]|uniref:TetR/AcrR family transcriptional regulator n=1 Tax=Nocardia brasiliensis TaxID=37326 RepID=UPI002453AB74|nr:TetR/AcrR family transcriptional regulator [Nocardia brasiliensis]